MGVRGLTTVFDDQHHCLFEPTKLWNQCLVFDGNSLIFYLYSKLNARCGGDYGEFQNVVLHFFRNLAECNIYAVIVLDGAFDINKRSTQLYRLQNYAQSVPLCMTGEVVHGMDFLPLLAGEIFQQILEDLHIPFVYALHDADRDIAAIANALNAFVVSKDSDFFILPLKQGYISLNDLDWQQVCVCEQSHYIAAEAYNSSRLISRYNFNKDLLPVIPAILGCDWLGPTALSHFNNAHFLMVDPTLRKDSNKLRRVKIKLMFEWLAKQEDLNEVIGKLQRYYKSDKEIMSQVRWCVDFFQNLPESSECQSVLSEQMKLELKENPSCKSLLHSLVDKLVSSPVNCSAVYRTRRGIYPGFMFSVHSGNSTVLLPVVVGSVSQHSMHSCSYSIRRAAYSVTTLNKVLEYGQQGRNYQVMKKGITDESDHRCFCPPPQKIFELLAGESEIKTDKDMQILRQYMLETLLGCQNSNERLHSRFANVATKTKEIELLFLATLYWVSKTKPPECLVAAVLLVMANWDSSFTADISRLFPAAESSSCSVALIHRISEWQSCVKFTFMLNKVLALPLNEPRLHYNCTTIAAAAVQLSSRINPRVFPQGANLPDKLSARYQELRAVTGLPKKQGRRRGKNR